MPSSRRSSLQRPAPPPGLAFGEPDDRLQRGIQYAAAPRLIATASEYAIIRFADDGVSECRTASRPLLRRRRVHDRRRRFVLGSMPRRRMLVVVLAFAA